MRNSTRACSFLAASAALLGLLAPAASADTPWTVTTPTTQAPAPGWSTTDLSGEPTQAMKIAPLPPQAAPQTSSPRTVHTAKPQPVRVARQARAERRVAQSHAGSVAGGLSRRTRTHVAGHVGRSHVIRAGETLSGLFPGSWHRVARLNGISNPNLIFVGQVVNY